MCSIRAFQLGRCHLCAPGTGASREPHGGGRPPLWPPVAPGCEGGFGGPGSTPFPEHDADKDQRHVPGSPCQPHSRLESEADVVEGRARPAGAVSLRPACLPRWVWDGPGGPALCGVSSPSRVGRLNHSCTQGADVSEMPAFQWGGGGAARGWGTGQFCWVGTAPVRCLDWAQPNLTLVPRGLAGGGQPACSCWPLPTAPRWGQSAGTAGTAPLFRAAGTSLLPACSLAPSGGPGHGGHVLGCRSPEDARGGTLTPLQRPRPLMSLRLR